MSEPSSPDIVTVLDLWIDYWTAPRGENAELAEMAQRARDEIMALRQDRDTLFAAMAERGPAIRADALEEAALALETMGGETLVARGVCAFVIRALKDKR